MTNWECLLHCFKKQKAKLEEKKTKTDASDGSSYASKKLMSIHEFLRSPTNKVYCHFLLYTLKVFDSVLLKLQSEDPMVTDLQDILVNLLRDLFSRFMRPEAASSDTDVGKVRC